MKMNASCLLSVVRGQLPVAGCLLFRYNRHVEPTIGRGILKRLNNTMIKTFTPVVSHRLEKPNLPVMMPMGTTLNGSSFWPATSSVVSNFEFGSLRFV